MTGSKDLPPSPIPFGKVFYNNQFVAKAVFPPPSTTLQSKVAIVTGCNTGLGYEAASQLLSLHLSTLVMAVRSQERGAVAAAKLRTKYPGAEIKIWLLDMTSYPSIQAFVKRVDCELQHIDFVLLNAGVGKWTFVNVPSTGHEECLQVNYLSTVFLATLLIPVLKAKRVPNTQPTRLTIVSAALTLAAAFPQRDADPLFPALDDPKAAVGMREYYNTSKLLMTMWLWKMVDYVSADDVILNLADPAWVRGTELTRDVKGVGSKAGLYLFGLLGRTVRNGASCLVDAMVNHGKESHGCFLMSWHIHPFNPLLYTPEGQVIIERVWKETMAEFEFANIKQILGELKA